MTALHTVESATLDLMDWRVFARANRKMDEFERHHCPNRVRTSSLKMFPLDCLLLTLDYLSKAELLLRCSRVGKLWYTLTKHPLLWCSFSLQHLVNSSGLPVVHKGRHPVGYTHSKVYKEGFWMRAVSEGRFQQLRALELQTADIGCRQLKRMLKQSPILQKIDLSHCQCVDDGLLEEVHSSLCGQAATHHQVVGETFASETTGTLHCLKLNFTSEGGWSFDGIVGLYKAMGPQLTHLELSGVEHINVTVFQCALLNLPNLSTLKARSSSMGPLAFANVSVAGLPRLKVLDASYCLTVDDVFLTEVARCCSRISEFYVAGCKQITDRGMVQFRLRFEDHAKAKCQAIPDQSGDSCEGQEHHHHPYHSLRKNNEDDDILGGPSCLTVLGLESCLQLSDTSFSSLSSAFPRLERLLVDRTNFGGFGLKEAAKLGKTLELLSVNNCLRLRKDIAFDNEGKQRAQRMRHVFKAADRKFLQIR